MKFNEPIRHIVTHADCPDGTASALILRECWPDAVITFARYGDTVAVSPRQLWCDMTPPKDQAQSFIDAGAYILDHHATARETIALFGERGCYADEPGVSGAMLAYRECYVPMHGPDPYVRSFATLAGVRDCWLTESASWLSANAQAAMLATIPFAALPSLLDGTAYVALNRIGHELYEKRLRDADRVATGAIVAGLTDQTRPFAFINRNDLISDVAEALRRLGFADKILALVSFQYVDRTLVYSMRSIGDFDCAAFAKQLGGGGHTKAAGFTAPMDPRAAPIMLFLAAYQKLSGPRIVRPGGVIR